MVIVFYYASLHIKACGIVPIFFLKSSIISSFPNKTCHTSAPYHKEDHQDFSTKALAYRKITVDSDAETASEILEYLKTWLVKHFQEADKKSTDHFNKNELKQIND